MRGKLSALSITVLVLTLGVPGSSTATNSSGSKDDCRKYGYAKKHSDDYKKDHGRKHCDSRKRHACVYGKRVYVVFAKHHVHFYYVVKHCGYGKHDENKYYDDKAKDDEKKYYDDKAKDDEDKGKDDDKDDKDDDGKDDDKDDDDEDKDKNADEKYDDPHDK